MFSRDFEVFADEIIKRWSVPAGERSSYSSGFTYLMTMQ